MNGPGSQQRMIIALLVIAGASIGVALTMEPGKPRSLAWVLLGFFAFRVVLGYFNLKRYGEREWSKSGSRGHVFPRKPK
jgi:hypothetical protein